MRSSLGLLLFLLAACGGSASESPWPEEPVENEPGPSGERLQRGNTLDTKKLPDRYTKKKKKEDGEEEPVDEEPLEEEPPEDEESPER